VFLAGVLLLLLLLLLLPTLLPLSLLLLGVVERLQLLCFAQLL
jgi:hypothetical protein